MDDKTIQRNLQTSIILFVLCLIVTIAAALLQWTEITIAMGVRGASLHHLRMVAPETPSETPFPT